jgi:hypothetical protein
MFEEIQPLATLLATGTGIYVALNGLRSWKREHTGKRDIELCQRVIESFYEAEQRLIELRSPASFPSVESAERPKQGPEGEKDAKRRDEYFVPLARLRKQREFWVSFLALKYRVRALFGKTALKPFDDVDLIVRELRAAASTRYTMMYSTGELGGDLADTMGAWHRIIWDTTEDNDPIRIRMRTAIAEMEEICIPIVRGTDKSPAWLRILRRGA